MNKILSILFISLTLTGYSQNNLLTNKPFKAGEKLSYIASYNMKGLMTELAGIEMEVIAMTIKEKPIYRLMFITNTLTSWDDYVKVRHAYQSYVDVNSLKPLLMKQDSDVKGEITKGTYKFSSKTGKINMNVTSKGVKKPLKSIGLTNNSFDVVSMIYYARALNYKTMTVGTKTPINIIALERAIPLNIKYLGKETINVDGIGNTNCYKIALVLNQKFIVEPDVTFMWISADDKQIPVKISTIFKEGKAEIKLKK